MLSEMHIHFLQLTEVSIEIIKSIDHESWLQWRNKIVTSVVKGICDEKVSDFQKCVAVEHLYSLANDQFVLPFSFLINVLLFSYKFEASIECG